MAGYSHKRQRAAALATANKVRKLIGLPPAKTLSPGQLYSERHCAISATIGAPEEYTVRTGYVYVRVHKARSWDPGTKIPHSKATRAFVTSFDAGKFPDLIARTD